MKTAQQVSVEFLDAYRRLAIDAHSRLGWRILVHLLPFNGSDEALRAALANGDEIESILPEEYRERHLAIADLVRRLRDDEQLSEESERALTASVGKSLAEIKESLHIVDEGDDRPAAGEDDGVGPDEPTIVSTSLVGAKGLSAAYVFVVGFNDGHFPRDADAITDDEVCCFLVGLSRTRKECHLISCLRLGAEPLSISRFASWIDDELVEVIVNAAYFSG